MNLPLFLQNPVHVLGGAAAIGAVAVMVAALPPGETERVGKSRSTTLMEAPDADKLNERIPDTGAVLEKHLFVPGREATGQNSFPDLIVKGVYVGEKSSVILSLKSKPQANLRVWLGEVESTLNSITDPRDPRQSLVTFLREWPIKEIRHESLVVEHFITGEVETYEVDYVAAKKVKDDAARGYGQGVMPQEKVAASGAAKNSNQQSAKRTNGQSGNRMQGGAGGIMQMMQSIPPEQRMQIMQRMMGGGPPPRNNQSNQNSGSNNNSKNSGSSKKKSR